MTVQIRMDTADLRRLAVGLGDLEESVLKRAMARAINKVAAKAMTRSRKLVTEAVNLKAGYVRERMKLSRATNDKPSATITARQRATTLARMGARIITARNSVKSRRAKGDKLRGIAPGRKAAGVSVHVLRASSRKRLAGAFLIPLRSGNVEGGNGMGVFTREGPGRNNIRHRYTASVARYFERVVGEQDFADEIQDDLEERLLKQLRHEVQRALQR